MRESDFLEDVERSGDIFYLYKQIIERASTIESVPYLLQALKSEQLIKRDMPMTVDPEIFIDTWVDYGEVNIAPMEYHLTYTYAVYETKDYHEVFFPFGELAKSRLVKIMAEVEDQKLRDTISNAIAIFSEREPKGIQETHRREELISTG